MSHTPLDGSNGRTSDRESESSDADEDTGFGGVLERVRGVCGRLGRPLRAWLQLSDRGATVDADDYPDEMLLTESRQTDVSTLGNDESALQPVVSDATGPERVPVSEGDGPRERPELEVQWGEDRLTLVEPDEPGAQISSDTWSEVDP